MVSSNPSLSERIRYIADRLWTTNAIRSQQLQEIAAEVVRLERLPAIETSAPREAEAARLLRLAEEDTLTGLTESDGIQWLADVRRWLAGTADEASAPSAEGLLADIAAAMTQHVLPAAFREQVLRLFDEHNRGRVALRTANETNERRREGAKSERPAGGAPNADSGSPPPRLPYNERYARRIVIQRGDLCAIQMALGAADDYLRWLDSRWQGVRKGAMASVMSSVQSARRLALELSDTPDVPAAEASAPPSLLASEINALPERVRQFIHDLETRADPAGDLRRANLAEETRDALLARLGESDEEIMRLREREGDLEREIARLRTGETGDRNG